MSGIRLNLGPRAEWITSIDEAIPLVREHAQRVSDAADGLRNATLRYGRLLLDLRPHVAHGGWNRFLALAGVHRTRAHRAMKIAEAFADEDGSLDHDRVRARVADVRERGDMPNCSARGTIDGSAMDDAIERGDMPNCSPRGTIDRLARDPDSASLRQLECLAGINGRSADEWFAPDPARAAEIASEFDAMFGADVEDDLVEVGPVAPFTVGEQLAIDFEALAEGAEGDLHGLREAVADGVISAAEAAGILSDFRARCRGLIDAHLSSLRRS